MQSSESIKKILENVSIDCEIIPHAKNATLLQVCDELSITLGDIVRAIQFKDEETSFITLVPISHILDIDSLQEKLSRAVLPMTTSSSSLDETEEDASCFAFANISKSDFVIDASLQSVADLYFPVTSEQTLIKVSKEQFLNLSASYQVQEFSVPLTEVVSKEFNDGLNFKNQRIIDKLENVEGLPAMPEMGYRVLQISRDPNSAAKDLSKVIELDPSLSAQIMSYSTSAFYGYQGGVESVRDAIARVLGFDLVANLALGIAVGKEFKIPAEGPLGLSNFWRHAVYTSALVEKLAKSLPKSKAIKPGLVYLCGLLHNFGHLLLGHVFASGFDMLNRSIMANPDIDINILEKFNLGSTHQEIGANLLEKWQMPLETIAVARYHHIEEIAEEHAEYVALIQIVDHLLKRSGIGDAVSGELPVQALSLLALSEDKILSIVNPLLESCTELDNIANKLAN